MPDDAPAEVLRRTPLYEVHRELGARLVPFAGWEMPVQYTGILEETTAVRKGVGIFDISHMGRVRIHGAHAQDLLQRLTTNDVAALAHGHAHYSLLTNPEGGIIDDIIVYRVGDEAFLVVVNASNTEKDLQWIRSHVRAGVTVRDETAETAMVAVQGPGAPELVAGLAGTGVLALPRFAFVNAQIESAQAIVCRTGYTGEDGFELIVPAAQAAMVWRAVQERGGVPCGLGARDVLRIEAGYPLYGHEIDDSTTPVEAGLMWVVKPDKGEFSGRDRIEQQIAVGASRRLMGLTLAERMVPRQGYTLLADGDQVGVVTSGAFSPTVGHSVAMAYIDVGRARPGTQVDVAIRMSRIPATIVPKKDLRKS